MKMEVLNALWCLKKAGYKEHHKGFIRIDEKSTKGNRYHAFITGENEIELHYDKVVEGWRHSSQPKFNKLLTEKNRIKRL